MPDTELNMPRIMYQIVYHEICNGCTTSRHQEGIRNLVMSAANAGFHGIDVAGQADKYYEPGFDKALEELFASGIARNSLFIQAKVNPYSSNEINPSVPLMMQ